MAAGRLERLKPKHHSVLNATERQRARILAMRVDRDKLLTRAVTPTVAAKNHILFQIQSIGREDGDLAAEITHSRPSAAPPRPGAGTVLPDYIETANRAGQRLRIPGGAAVEENL